MTSMSKNNLKTLFLSFNLPIYSRQIRQWRRETNLSAAVRALRAFGWRWDPIFQMLCWAVTGFSRLIRCRMWANR